MLKTEKKPVEWSGKLNDFGFHTHGTSSYSMAAVKTEQRVKRGQRGRRRGQRRGEEAEEGKRKMKLKLKLKALLSLSVRQTETARKGRRGSKGSRSRQEGGGGGRRGRGAFEKPNLCYNGIRNTLTTKAEI